MSSVVSIGHLLTPKNTALGISGATMIFKPLITLSNKELPEDTKRYTALREFFSTLFSFTSIATLVGFAERNIPKTFAHKKYNIDLTENLLHTIKKTDWGLLSNPHKEIKGVFLITSLIASASTAAILTPLLCNIFLNKLLTHIMGKKKEPPHANYPDVFAKSLNGITLTRNKTDSEAFNTYLQQSRKNVAKPIH